MRWFILCLATASPAIACPVAGDLTTGILATSADGTTELYQHGTGDDVLVTATYSDGYQSANLLIHGAYVKQLASLTDGVLDIPTALRTDYETTPAVPKPNTSGTFQTKTGSLADGFSQEIQTFTWGAVEEFSIGDCSYSSIPGTLTYKGQDVDVIETVSYIPDLGIGLLLSYTDAGLEPDNFTYISIETP